MAAVAEPDWGVARNDPRTAINTVDTGVNAAVETKMQLWHPPRDPFNGASTTHSDFPGWMPAPKADKANAAPFGWKANLPAPPRAPTSTSRDDFCAKLMDPMEAFATSTSDALPLAPPPRFTASSSYSANFTQPEITPKEPTQAGNAWPGMLSKVTPQTRLFQTTTASAYPPHQVLPKIPAPEVTKEPDPEPVVEEQEVVPFEGSTSYSDDFKPCVPMRRHASGHCCWTWLGLLTHALVYHPRAT